MDEDTFRFVQSIGMILTPILTTATAVYLGIKFNRVEKNVDGKLTEMVNAKVGEADARGQLKGIETEQDRVAEVAPVAPVEPVKVKVVKPDIKSGA